MEASHGQTALTWRRRSIDDVPEDVAHLGHRLKMAVVHPAESIVSPELTPGVQDLVGRSGVVITHQNHGMAPGRFSDGVPCLARTQALEGFVDHGSEDDWAALVEMVFDRVFIHDIDLGVAGDAVAGSIAPGFRTGLAQDVGDVVRHVGPGCNPLFNHQIQGSFKRSAVVLTVVDLVVDEGRTEDPGEDPIRRL